MDETMAVNSGMGFEGDYSVIYDAVSDEELESAAEGLPAMGNFRGLDVINTGVLFPTRCLIWFGGLL
jgi:hypothetical protein